MFKSKVILLIMLATPACAFAAQPCQVRFHNFVVDREPHGYPINKATLRVVSASACSSRTDKKGNVAIRIGETVIDVYDRVTHQHSAARSTTFINVNPANQRAELFNNYLNINIEVPIELKGRRMTIKLTQPPKALFGPSAPPDYILRLGAELTINLTR